MNYSVQVDNLNINETSTNNSFNEKTQDYETLEIPLYTMLVVTFFFTLLFITGIVGNFLVIYVVCKSREMRSSTNIFLVNLSVADILVILVCLPAGALEFYMEKVWYLGNAMCKIVALLENTVAHASVLVIIAISFDRYYAICRPLQAQYTCTVSRTVKIITFVWCLALASCFPFLFISQELGVEYYDGTYVKICISDLGDKWNWKEVYVILILVLFFAVPLVILVVLYVLISRQLLSDPHVFRKNESSDSATSANIRQRHQVVIMLMSVILLFFVCLLPQKVFALWNNYAPLEDIEQVGFQGHLSLEYFGKVMLYVNSAINPIIYNVISSKFRDAFKKALGLHVAVRRQSTITTQVSLRRKSSTAHQLDMTSLNSNNQKAANGTRAEV